MAAPVILVEAAPRRAADGVPVTVRLAGGGATVAYHYGGEHWRAGLTGLPKSTASLDFDGEQLGGGGVAQSIELGWAPASSAALSELSDLYWTDAPITVRVGPEGAAMPAIVSQGLVLEAPVDRGTLRIALADQTADLTRALLTDRYAGTGGIEGPIEFESLIKSRAWGRCFNVPGRQIDAATNIWVFGDPRRAWSSFDQVRDKGVAADAGTLTVLGWQGSAEATFAALKVTPATEGGGVLCPSIACVKWWTQPAGDLHADIRGETDGGYVETAPEIAQRLVAARSTLTFAAGAVAAAAAARPAPFGWRVDSDSSTAASEISTMLGGVSLSWLLVDGAIVFRPWDWTAPVRVGRSFSVTRRSTTKPIGSRKLGYRRNWSPMARGDLAALVLARDILYEDGQTLDDVLAELNLRVDRVASDSWLSRGEKPQARIDYDALVASKDALVARCEALGSPADLAGPRDQAINAVNNLRDYLAGLAPVWTDTTVDTAIDPAVYRAEWSAAYTKVAAFSAAITGRKGDPGAGAFTLANVNNTTVATNSVTKVSGGANWNGKARTIESYRGAFVAGVVEVDTFVGLITNPTLDDSYGSIDYAVHHSSSEGGRMSIWRSGTPWMSLITSTPDPVPASVQHDGTTVTYVVNGAAFSHPAPGPQQLYGSFALAREGATVSSIVFTSSALAGLNGHNAISALLTNEAHTVPANAAGNVTSYNGANSVMRVYDGGVDVTDSGLFALSIVSNPQTLSISVDGRSFGVYDGFDASEETASIVARVTGSGQYAGVVIDKTFSLAKSKAGGDGNSPSITTLTASTQLARYDTNGGFIPGQSIRFIAQKQNSGSAITVWRVRNCDDAVLSQFNGGAAFAGALGYGSYAESDDVVVMSGAAVEAYITVHGGAPGRFSVGAVAFGWVNWDDVSVQKVQDGARGADGKGALSAYLTNEAFSYAVDVNGLPTAVPGGVGDGRMRVFYGLTEVTGQCTFTAQQPYNLTVAFDASGNYSCGNLYADNGYAYVIASYQGQAIALTVTGTKSRQGGAGISAKTLYITSSSQTLSVNAGDALEPADQAITFTAVKQNTTATVFWDIFDGYGNHHSAATHAGTDTGDSITIPGANIGAIINYPQAVGQGVYKTMRVVGALSDGVVISDTISVVKVAAGANGTPGSTPTTWDLQTYSVSVTATSAGVTNPGQIPKNVAVKVMKGTVDVTAAATITVAATAGISATYASSVVSINQIDADGKVTVNATSEGVALAAKTIDVSRSRDPAPPASSTSLSRTDYFDVSSASYGSADTAVISLQSNASGQLNYTYFDQYVISQPQTNPKRTCTLASRVMYRQTNTSAWSYTGEVVGSQAVQSGRVQDDGDEGPGQVGTTNTLTGLAANTYYDVSVSTRRYGGTSGATGYGAMTLTIRQ